MVYGYANLPAKTDSYQPLVILDMLDMGTIYIFKNDIRNSFLRVTLFSS